MKFIGMLLIVLAGSGLGLYYSRRLHRQVTTLRQTERVLEAFGQRLRYTAEPLPVLVDGLAKSEVFRDFSLLQNTARRLPDMPFAKAFSESVEELIQEGKLPLSSCSILLEFGEGCGRTGRAEQATHMAVYREQIGQVRQEAEQIERIRGRIYRTMGFAGGVAVALLLW